jgi:hypothetical protein
MYTSSAKQLLFIITNITMTLTMHVPVSYRYVLDAVM